MLISINEKMICSWQNAFLLKSAKGISVNVYSKKILKSPLKISFLFSSLILIQANFGEKEPVTTHVHVFRKQNYFHIRNLRGSNSAGNILKLVQY